MRSRYSRRSCFILALAFISCSSSAGWGQKLHPRIKKGETVLNRVVILPVGVILTKDGMKGGEQLEKESAAAAPVIENAVTKVLTEKKLQVLDSPFKPEALASDEKLKYAVADLQRNYAETLGKMVKKQKDVEKGRFTLGDEVLLLNQDDDIDAFLFVGVSGQRKSGGKRALGVITLSPLMMSSNYTISVAIADARTGDILAYSFAASIFDITKPDDKNLIEMLKGMFKKLPAGKAPDAAVEKP